jgi:two-component sensor histidine kinase
LRLIWIRLDSLEQLQAEFSHDAFNQAALARLRESLVQLNEIFNTDHATFATTNQRIQLAQQRATQLQRLYTVTHIDSPVFSHSLSHWRSLIMGIVVVGLITLGGVAFLMRLAFRADAMRSRSEQALVESEARYKRLAAQRRLLLNELDHRVKNNLAGLMSLVNIYESSSRGVDEFAASVNGKLLAMGAAHEMMGQNGQLPIAFKSLIRRIANQFRETKLDKRQLEIDCDDIQVVSRQITPLAIICQELFANSSKYGAYRNGAGRVQIQCKAADLTPEGIGIRMIWREFDGPPVSPPQQLGQGLDMVESFVQYELKGACEFFFEDPGFRFELRCRLDSPNAEPQAQHA